MLVHLLDKNCDIMVCSNDSNSNDRIDRERSVLLVVLEVSQECTTVHDGSGA